VEAFDGVNNWLLKSVIGGAIVVSVVNYIAKAILS
jgi:hypothetical protein